MFYDEGLQKFNAVLFPAGFVGQRPAAEAQRPDGAVNHGGTDLKVVPVGDGIIRFIDTVGQKMRDKLDLLAV